MCHHWQRPLSGGQAADLNGQQSPGHQNTSFTTICNTHSKYIERPVLRMNIDHTQIYYDLSYTAGLLLSTVTSQVGGAQWIVQYCDEG